MSVCLLVSLVVCMALFLFTPCASLPLSLYLRTDCLCKGFIPCFSIIRLRGMLSPSANRRIAKSNFLFFILKKRDCLAILFANLPNFVLGYNVMILKLNSQFTPAGIFLFYCSYTGPGFVFKTSRFCF